MTRVRDAAWRTVVAWRSEDGATAVEYALMVALIALVIVGAVTLLGQSTGSQFADPTLNGALNS